MRFLLFFLLLELSLFASIGKISALNGNVVVDRNNQQLNANIGFDLEEKDLVLTDDKSKAQITLNDGTVLSLGKNSKLNINEYVFDENNSSNSKAEFKFVEGTFKSITGAIGKVAPEKFKLETKSASIGIRGTIVVGNQEKVACTQGQITVTSAGVTQVLGAGMMTNTEIGKPPTAPTKIEGNLLKEVDNIGAKEESKSTTSETKEKASEEKTSENSKSEKSNEKEQTSTTSQQASTEKNSSQPVQQSSNLQTSSLNQNTSSASSNVSTFTEVTNTVNTTITQTSANKIQEDIADAKKKAEAIDAATILANEANTIAQSVATASTDANSASSSVSSIAIGSTDSQITTAVTNATAASTSASTLSSQAQTLKTEIATLLAQAQNASASEAVVIYEQIKTKTNLLNSKLTEATSLVTTAQNSLKTVSVNLASSLSSQANTIAQSVATASTDANSASSSVSSIAIGSTDSQITTAVTNATAASTSASTLSSQAQTLKTEIATLLAQAQNASASEAVVIYEQIKTKTNLLNSKLTEATSLVTTAQNSLKTVSVNLASSLSSQANTIAQSVATASTDANSASSSVSSIAIGSTDSQITTAVTNATAASTSASTLSSQAQTLKTEIATLLAQAQNASASEAVVIYEQIKTKTNLLNSKLTEATSLVTTAQNSLKTVSVNLASSLSSQANTIAQSVATASTDANSASSSVSSIAQGLEVSTDTQTLINTASNASTSASTLSSQAQTLKTEIATLLAQAQNASASEAVVIYEQIKTKTNLLNSKLTEATSLVTTAQNSLKTVSVNLASSLSSQASTVIETITSQATNIQTSANTVSQLLENASTSALAEVNTSSNDIAQAEETINTLSSQAQTLKDGITTLLTQAQSASASEAATIYGQIKIKSDSLNSLLTQVQTASSLASTIVQNISNAIVNVPVYSVSIDVLNSNGGLGSKVFIVPSGGATVTMATYGSSDGIWNGEISGNRNGFDPVLILLKWNNTTSKYEYVSDSKKDDTWIVADNFYNAILNITLSEGNYKVLVADYPFTSDEAEKNVNRGTSEEGNVKIYLTSTSNLTFDTTDTIAIEKYSYITRMNNKAYINSLSYQTASIQDANPKFGILADSNVGTTVKIDDYGYFVTISDSFDNSKNVFLNNSEIDDESSWGYWTQALQSDNSGTQSINMKSSWISGNQVTAPTNYNATFQGQVIGGVTDENHTGYIKVDSDNVFKATIDIGSATITDSLIKFKDSLFNSWSGTFNTSGTANVNQQGFTAPISGTGTTGSLTGKYYGTNVNNTPTVQSIGGAFNMNKGESSANGVFKAREIPTTVPSL